VETITEIQLTGKIKRKNYSPLLIAMYYLVIIGRDFLICATDAHAQSTCWYGPEGSIIRVQVKDENLYYDSTGNNLVSKEEFEDAWELKENVLYVSKEED
jgi:hypothetical protein